MVVLLDAKGAGRNDEYDDEEEQEEEGNDDDDDDLANRNPVEPFERK